VKRFVEILGSYGLAVIVLLLLMVLTLFGTLEQADMSLFDVQKKYFESIIVLDSPILIPLPGAYLLLSLLFVNLVVGGMLRLRRNWSRIGIFITHIGIAMLLLGGFVEFKTSNKGHMTLYEGNSASTFRSYHEWELAVAERLPDGSSREYVIHNDAIKSIDKGDTVRFTAGDLPFDVELSGYLRNAQPRPAAASGAGIDGFQFEELAPQGEAEANAPGMTIALNEPGGTRHEGLVWGLQRAPWQVRVEGRRFEVDLRKKRWTLPFEITLRKFTRDLHPGTGMAAAFSSDVTCSEGNVAQDIHISMNEPLRREGFTLYQSGWGPQNARPGERLFSTFSVVENPADQVPLYSTIVIAVGLLYHFLRKLRGHIRSEAGRQA